ncbi:MAG: hypothetical protein NVSMB62_05210 [Acidobacteriaceae bacterium]
MAHITNGRLDVAVYLPDVKRGYYRGSRFDWSGIVGCASLNEHTFFGEWFAHYDPMINDAVTGPAEEFRHPTSELGYDEAAPGGLFLKPGVGVLRRIDSSPYRFGAPYPIVDHGRWSARIRSDSITFRQDLRSSIGYAYRYEKILSLDRRGNVLSLQHHLLNRGSKPIDTAIYDHDFYMLDGAATGPDMQVRFPFAPVAESPLPETVRIDGRTLRFVAPLQQRPGLGTYLTGFSSNVSDYDFTTEDKVRGLGVEQSADSPIERFYLWGTTRTICPEAYIAIHVPPGQMQSWTIHYRFFTP